MLSKEQYMAYFVLVLVIYKMLPTYETTKE